MPTVLEKYDSDSGDDERSFVVEALGEDQIAELDSHFGSDRTSTPVEMLSEQEQAILTLNISSIDLDQNVKFYFRDT